MNSIFIFGRDSCLCFFFFVKRVEIMAFLAINKNKMSDTCFFSLIFKGRCNFRCDMTNDRTRDVASCSNVHDVMSNSFKNLSA